MDLVESLHKSTSMHHPRREPDAVGIRPRLTRVSDIDWGQGTYEATAADLWPAARELVDAAQIKPGEHVVDVGAGTGNVALLAADLGARVTAVEPAARLREVIQETAGARDLTVVDGTAASIPLTDGSADAILSNFAVIFAPDPAAAIAELSRVAAPTGRILLTSWIPGVMGKLVGVVLSAVQEVTGQPPVVLLDDVLSELDDKRQSHLATKFRNHQIIMTSTNPPSILGSAKVIRLRTH